MAETARLAVFHGTGRPFEIREYPVPDPEPGAMLIKIALANVCGSDMHYWRGEQDYVKMGRPLPLNTGHEHVGTVAKLGQGVTADSMGQPLKIGDRVLYRYFCPCGRCKACLRSNISSMATAQARWRRAEMKQPSAAASLRPSPAMLPAWPRTSLQAGRTARRTPRPISSRVLPTAPTTIKKR